MKLFAILIAVLLILCAVASGQGIRYPTSNTQGVQYSTGQEVQYPTTTQATPYSTITTGGAPTPPNPQAPESLKLQVPSAVIASDQVPPINERSQRVTMSNQQAALPPITSTSLMPRRP